MLEEKIFFFKNNDDLNLLGFYHIPTQLKQNLGIIYTHPFAEEQNCSHSIVVKAAREFAKLGIPVMRFDLRGCGDSEGELENTTIDQWLKDIDSAIAVFKRELKIEKIGFWGIRLGCGLNVLAAQNRPDIAFHILWQPVFEFDKFIQQFIRQKLSTEITSQSRQNKNMNALIQELEDNGTLEIMGYKISLVLYKSLMDTGNIEARFTQDEHTYIASISLMEKPNYAISRFVKNLEANNTPFKFSHIKTEPFWDRYWQWNSKQLIEDTAHWLSSEI